MRRDGEAGFTLIEALVALAIVGLSTAVLFKVISDNLDRAHRARDETLAMARVQSLLTQAQAGTPAPGVSDGRFADGFSWRVQVEPYVVGANWPVQAVTIAATVSWREAGETEHRTLATLRVIPKAGAQ
ncbi:MAG: type II secretion system protein [Rhizomicrobium sp.]